MVRTTQKEKKAKEISPVLLYILMVEYIFLLNAYNPRLATIHIKCQG
jgi:hypothetical protein